MMETIFDREFLSNSGKIGKHITLLEIDFETFRWFFLDVLLYCVVSLIKG